SVMADFDAWLSEIDAFTSASLPLVVDSGSFHVMHSIATFRKQGFVMAIALRLLVCIALVPAGLSAQTSRSTSAASYVGRGNEWFKKGEINKAIEDYTTAILFSPQSAFIYYNRAHAHQAVGDVDAAIQDYSKAIQFDPKFAYAYNNR